MAVWLIAEGRVQIVRSSRVVTVEAVPAEGSVTGSRDPVEPVRRSRQVRIMAGTRCGPGADELTFSRLLTCPGEVAILALQELAQAIAGAEARASDRGAATLFVHGPPSQLASTNAAPGEIWQVSEQLPVRDWPRTGSFWRNRATW